MSKDRYGMQEMTQVYTSGTLGDTYIACLKIKCILDMVEVFHFTKHSYWRSLISEIYRLPHNIGKVTFADYPRVDLEEITSNTHEQNMDFFPKWDVKGQYTIMKPYIVLQPHSGKPSGGNHKSFPKFFIQSILAASAYQCVLLGTDRRYEHITNCINLIGKTTITDTIQIIRNAEKFIGPEGLLSFIALSHKVKSTIYYSSHEAVEKRIFNTPWEKYATLVDINEIWGVV